MIKGRLIIDRWYSGQLGKSEVELCETLIESVDGRVQVHHLT